MHACAYACAGTKLQPVVHCCYLSRTYLVNCALAVFVASYEVWFGGGREGAFGGCAACRWRRTGGLPLYTRAVRFHVSSCMSAYLKCKGESVEPGPRVRVVRPAKAGGGTCAVHAVVAAAAVREMGGSLGVRASSPNAHALHDARAARLATLPAAVAWCVGPLPTHHHGPSCDLYGPLHDDPLIRRPAPPRVDARPPAACIGLRRCALRGGTWQCSVHAAAIIAEEEQSRSSSGGAVWAAVLARCSGGDELHFERGVQHYILPLPAIYLSSLLPSGCPAALSSSVL